MDELMHNFNKILDEKREEIIEIANNKKTRTVNPDKKMTQVDKDKLPVDISSTLRRINEAAEKKYKDSAKYKKEINEQNRNP
jgi:hypothetical protein